MSNTDNSKKKRIYRKGSRIRCPFCGTLTYYVSTIIPAQRFLLKCLNGHVFVYDFKMQSDALKILKDLKSASETHSEEPEPYFYEPPVV